MKWTLTFFPSNSNFSGSKMGEVCFTNLRSFNPF